MTNMLTLDIKRWGAGLTAAAAAIAAMTLAPAAAASPTNQSAHSPARPHVLATYKGQRIDLTAGLWGTAKICVERRDTTITCYEHESDLPKSMRLPKTTGSVRPSSSTGAGPMSSTTLAATTYWGCSDTYACVFEHIQSGGRRLQFQSNGRKNLSDYGFRDQTSSVVNAIPWAILKVFDDRWAIDPNLYLTPYTSYRDLTKVPYTSYKTNGNWNDRTDYLVIG